MAKQIDDSVIRYLLTRLVYLSGEVMLIDKRLAKKIHAITKLLESELYDRSKE